MTIKEEIKFALECANKDIDLMPDQEEYMRGYLGGQLSIVGILEKHFGKFINDDEIYKKKTAFWRFQKREGDECVYRCSNCGRKITKYDGFYDFERLFAYCPKCGAKMKGE